MEEQIPLLNDILDKIESGELKLNPKNWIMCYPSLQHKEEDKRWFFPSKELEAMVVLRRELQLEVERLNNHLMWGKHERS